MAHPAGLIAAPATTRMAAGCSPAPRPRNEISCIAPPFRVNQANPHHLAYSLRAGGGSHCKDTVAGRRGIPPAMEPARNCPSTITLVPPRLLQAETFGHLALERCERKCLHCPDRCRNFVRLVAGPAHDGPLPRSQGHDPGKPPSSPGSRPAPYARSASAVSDSGASRYFTYSFGTTCQNRPNVCPQSSSSDAA